MSEIVESRLSKKDMTPEGGCSGAFKMSLKSFLDEYIKSLKSSWDTFDLTEACAGTENAETTKPIIQNISGVTARQLEVLPCHV